MSNGTTAPGRRALALILAGMLLATMSGCRDLSDGEHALDAMKAAQEALHEAGSVRGSVTLGLTFSEVPGVGEGPGDGAQPTPGASAGLDPAAVLGPAAALAPRLPIDVDFASGRTEVGAPSFGPAPDASTTAGASLVYEGVNVYARRPGVEPGSGSPAWVSTDLSAIGDLDDELELREKVTLAVGTLLSATDPKLILELLDGAMVGATKATGENRFDTVISTERFLAERDQTAAERDAAENVLDLWSLEGDTLDGQVSLDAEGRIRRLVVSGTSDFGAATLGFEMTVALDEYGIDHPVAVPGPEDRMAVDDLRDMFAESGIRDALGG